MRKYKIKRWLTWEFAPTWVTYFPVAIYYHYLALRVGCWGFFAAVNPSLFMGGMFGESKMHILSKIPQKYLPHTSFIPEKISVAVLADLMKVHSLSFPIILKPDCGERGKGVEKINSLEEAEKYLLSGTYPLLMQSFLSSPEEYGVMYVRFPHEKKGRVTSITKKEYLYVIGDGVSNLAELFHQFERTQFHYEMLMELFSGELGEVLPKGEKRTLVSIGNHVRGTTFLNYNHLITKDLGEVFDPIADAFEGFYFGRFDLKTESWAELLKGNFKVMELNGVASEPAHIYQPQYNILQAYQDLFQHWHTASQIAHLNYQHGEQKIPAKELIQHLKAHFL
ncbi:MAG: hypothetical protein ACKVTZ_01780 [Bacteroidia bacterium]